MTLRQAWAWVPEWGKAFLIAFTLLLLLHVFVLRWVTVRNTSMYATLLPGDLVAVERWPAWTGFRRGDIAVFHDPLQDDRRMGARQLLVKRIVGLPGDRVELDDGRLKVNGSMIAPWTDQTAAWSVRLGKGADVPALLKQLGLPPDFVLPGITVFDLPLNDSLAALLKNRPGVATVQRKGPSSGVPGNLFPFSPNFPWNNDNYGPINVPAAGNSVPVDPWSLPLVDRIIAHYEGNAMEQSGNDLLINGKKCTRYTIRQDYYFVLGDSRSNSSDSRYWGFVPADHLVGRAAFILLHAGNGTGAVQGRSLHDL